MSMLRGRWNITVDSTLAAPLVLAVPQCTAPRAPSQACMARSKLWCQFSHRHSACSSSCLRRGG